LLLSRGYRVETHEDFDTLVASMSSENAPSMILMDVCSGGFSSDQAALALARAPRRLPVVAVSEGLEPEWIRSASSLAAVDLLFKPFNIERVLSSVRATITGAARVAGRVEEEASTSSRKGRARVLLVSRDPALISRLSAGLATRGFEVEVSPTTAEAIERTNYASHVVVVYDAQPASPADRLFAGQFRGRAGIGLVPIVYLAEPDAHRVFSGVDADRSDVRARDDSILALVETINRLRGDTRLGRTFVRYQTELAAELRYTGRSFGGLAVDVSRGGVMLRCDQMPPVGTTVSVRMRLPQSTTPVEATGRVVRVDLPEESGHQLPGIGVEFDKFAGSGEADLIRFLGTLDTTSPRRTTVIMAAPPPAGS
jgi:CheY-like chemotaxis protein